MQIATVTAWKPTTYTGNEVEFCVKLTKLAATKFNGGDNELEFFSSSEMAEKKKTYWERKFSK